MLRLPFFALVTAFVFLTILLPPRSALGITVGGWTAARGGDSGILAGGDFAATRNDLSAYFPTVTLAETGGLTSTFLNSIDVLLLDPVAYGASVENTSLTSAEQSALTAWVSAGGRALVLGENFNYYDTSQSMIGPFGPQWHSGNINGFVPGAVTDHTSFPAITDGPFGVVNTFTGGYCSWFDNVAPATPLGEWGAGLPSLAAMTFGSGKVVFFGDNTMLYGPDADAGVSPGNDTLRRNTLAYLLGIAPRNRYDYNSNGAVDAADYVLYRKTLGQTGSILAADGNLSHDIEGGDYNLWRAHFGDTNAPGSGAFKDASGVSSAAIPEPSSLVLLILAVAPIALRRRT